MKVVFLILCLVTVTYSSCYTAVCVCQNPSQALIVTPSQCSDYGYSDVGINGFIVSDPTVVLDQILALLEDEGASVEEVDDVVADLLEKVFGNAPRSDYVQCQYSWESCLEDCSRQFPNGFADFEYLQCNGRCTSARQRCEAPFVTKCGPINRCERAGRNIDQCYEEMFECLNLPLNVPFNRRF